MLKALGLEKRDDFLGVSDLERIAAYPVDVIVKATHPALFTVSRPSSDEVLRPESCKVLSEKCRLVRHDDRRNKHRSKEPRKAHVGLLHVAPDLTDAPLVVVNRDCEEATWLGQRRSTFNSLPHVSRVVEHAPRIDHVEAFELGEQASVEDVALGDAFHANAKTGDHVTCRRDRVRIEVERCYLCSQTACCDREETTPTSDIEKALSLEAANAKQVPQ